MNKPNLDLKDFSIAGRRPDAGRKPEQKTPSPSEEAAASAPADAAVPPASRMLPKPSEKQKQEAAEARAMVQEDVRYSLKNLKRSKQRSAKFFVNVALDYELKGRLQKAAMENDVKMTAVVKAALDFYLAENGY